jgi:hypothetical protein
MKPHITSATVIDISRQFSDPLLEKIVKGKQNSITIEDFDPDCDHVYIPLPEVVEFLYDDITSHPLCDLNKINEEMLLLTMLTTYLQDLCTGDDITVDHNDHKDTLIKV